MTGIDAARWRVTKALKELHEAQKELAAADVTTSNERACRDCRRLPGHESWCPAAAGSSWLDIIPTEPRPQDGTDG